MSSNGNISPVTDHLCGEFTGHRGALMVSLICAWMNGWINNREAGDLRRHLAHYDVTVMDINTAETAQQRTLDGCLWFYNALNKNFGNSS